MTIQIMLTVLRHSKAVLEDPNGSLPRDQLTVVYDEIRSSWLAKSETFSAFLAKISPEYTPPENTADQPGEPGDSLSQVAWALNTILTGNLDRARQITLLDDSIYLLSNVKEK